MREKVFEKIYNRHFNSFFLIAFHFLRRHDDAKHIVQEAFVKLWEQDINLHAEERVRNFLFIVVRNRCLNLLRDRKRETNKTQAESLLDSVNHLLLSETGEDVFLYQELSEKVKSSIDDLPSQCRQVFTLSRFEDMSNKDIAARLNISLKAVEANMTRALKRLREDLKPYLLEKKASDQELSIR